MYRFGELRTSISSVYCMLHFRMTQPQGRFRFDKDCDLALVNAVMLADAHVAKRGESMDKFNSAFDMFCASRPVIAKIERGMPAPAMRSVQEHWRKLIRDRRAANHRNVAASGVAEEYGDLEMTLDKTIESINQKKKENEREKESKRKREDALKAAATEVRLMATKRVSEDSGDEEAQETQARNSASEVV